MSWPENEDQFAAALVKHLSRPDMDVHQEVNDIDIVVVKTGGDVIAIETKLQLNADVIGQAMSRPATFRMVYVPKPSANVRNSRSHKTLIHACKQNGIGLGYGELRHTTAGERPNFITIVPPVRNSKAKPEEITDALCQATKHFNKAGTPGSVRKFNKHQDEFDLVRKWARENPGGELKRMKQEEHLTKEQHLRIKNALERDEIAGVVKGVVAGRLTINPIEANA